MKTQRSIGFLFLTIFLSACGSTPLFRANFDSDTIGARPNSSPPGDPVGDWIYISNPESAVPNPVEVVNIDEFDNRGNSLRYSNVNTPVWNRYVGFMSREIGLRTTEYFAFWNGRLDVSSSSSALDIWLGSSHFLPMASLRFEDGQILLAIGFGEFGKKYEAIGSYTTGIHTVLMRVDKPSATYAIVIVQQRGETIETGTRPVLYRDALRNLRPTLYMWFSEEGVHGSGSYLTDNVGISERAPDISEMMPR